MARTRSGAEHRENNANKASRSHQQRPSNSPIINEYSSKNRLLQGGVCNLPMLVNSIGLTDKRLYFMMIWGQCGWIESQKLPEGDGAILRKRKGYQESSNCSSWYSLRLAHSFNVQIGLLQAPCFPGIPWNVLCIHCFVHFNGFMSSISPNINFLRAGVCCIPVILKQIIQIIRGSW